MSTRCVAVAYAIFTSVLAGEAGAQPGPVRLEELAASWSGSRAEPSCEALPPNVQVPRGTERCVWRATSVHWADAELWGSRASGQDIDILFWQRNVADSLAAVRVADSLSQALTRGGLQEYGCRRGARRWQKPGLGVELGMTREKDGGEFRVFIAAVTQPGVLPTIMCPDAPALPITKQPSVRRRIA
ncbi:MAG TPA: hypothetical protein VE861_10825 [Gemmatimonadaceae bacterium]|nr:hypothetical protein [Gemmatimonadaceae bacterium]